MTNLVRRWSHGAKLTVGAVCLCVIAVGCGSSANRTTATTATPSEKLSVVVTTTQLADFVTTIGGSHVTVYDIVKTGVDPHSYKMTAADQNAVAGADVAIKSGAGLDSWFDTQATGLKTGVSVVDASVGVVLRPSTDPKSPLGDPHIWGSIVNAKLMVSNVRKALVAADPADASEFTSTERGYDSQLDGFVNDTTQSVGAMANKVLVSDHDAYGYFCDEFGLTCAGGITPDSGSLTPPSSTQITAAATALADKNALAVFADATGSPAAAEELATDLGVKVEEGANGLYGDSLGAPGGDADTYLKAQRHNVDAIVASLH